MSMCAIAGILGLNVDDVTAKQMLGSMLRRGPDGTGVYQEEICTQLEGEHYTLVYNGELYNTAELRRDLEKEGHEFEGHSDTEVVLHAYARWGEGCLEKLNGIFSFAVWEKKKMRLFLARDRIGVKPLFYKLHEGGLIFASEIKTILKYPSVKAELDEQGAAEIVLLGPGRTPGCGVFRGISELEPGCCGYWDAGRLNIRRYWKLLDREHTQDFSETAAYVRYLVEDAIRRQMVSDVPIGTFLSGGLDSSLISSVCARQLRQRGKRLKTFSVDYENNDRYFVPGKFQPNSDGDYIRLMA